MLKIAVLPGDDIGPEVVAAAMAVLEAAAKVFSIAYVATSYPFGGHAIDSVGEAFPLETKVGCLASDAVLLGAVGGANWDGLPGLERPESALLNLRSAMGVYANLRPAKLYKHMVDASPLKASLVPEGFDLLVVRELTGGIYFGQKGCIQENHCQSAFDVESYSEPEVRRIAQRAFEAALIRGRSVVSVDKANVLESSKLWRRVVEAVALDYPGVTLRHMYVDNAAMQLVLNPSQFDVVLTSNLFGDILSDEASILTGSIGLLPSASLGDGHRGLYEPIHGSAPDLAGTDRANPIGTILSVAIMLSMSLGYKEAAVAVEQAVDKVLKEGYCTQDLSSIHKNVQVIGTREMGQRIAEAVEMRGKADDQEKKKKH